MKTNESLKFYVIVTIAIYFCGQSVYLFFSGFTKYSQADKVTIMETFLLTTYMLCEVIEIFFINNHADSSSCLFRGELFGYQENLVSKYAREAAFRWKILLKGAVKSVYNVNDLHEKTGSSFRRGALDEIMMEEDTKYIKNNGTVMMNAKMIQDNQYMSEILAESCGSQKISSLNETMEDSFQYSVTRKNKLGVNCSNNISFLSGPKSGPCETPIDSLVENETASVKSIRKIEEYLKNSNEQMEMSIAIMIILILLLFYLPAQSFISYLIGHSKVEDLKLSIFVLVPFTENSSIDTSNKFLVVVFVQIVYLILLYKLSMDSFTMEILSFSTLKTEIELLLIRLDDFNMRLCENKNSGTVSSLQVRQKMLFEKFRQIVMHHQTVFRNVGHVNEVLRFTAISANGVICGYLCAAIFQTSAGPDIAFKANYVMVYIFLIMLLAQYSEEGQNISDKLEDVRIALYNLSWTNMPKEMKTSLLILLIRNTNAPKVTAALGIFDINRLNISKIIQASYSYFNVLNTLK